MDRIMGTGSRGSFTVEAAFVLSAVLLALFCLVLSFILMYHKILLTKTALTVVQNAAAAWGEQEGLYYRIMADSFLGDKSCGETVKSHAELEEKSIAIARELETGGPQDPVEKKLKKIQLAVYRELKEKMIREGPITVSVHYQNRFPQREVSVTLSQEMRIPFGKIKSFFDGKDTITLTATATAPVTEPAEYVRNVDLAVEYAARFKDAANKYVRLADLKVLLEKWVR